MTMTVKTVNLYGILVKIDSILFYIYELLTLLSCVLLAILLSMTIFYLMAVSTVCTATKAFERFDFPHF